MQSGETALARVGKSDFFAILGSGSYVVACGVLLTAACFPAKDAHKFDTRENLWSLSCTIEKHWAVALAALFLAFLVGNVLRALRVNNVDDLWKYWWCLKRKCYESFGKRFPNLVINSPHDAALWKSKFPYPDLVLLEFTSIKAGILSGRSLVVAEIEDELNSNLVPPRPDNLEVWHTTYNTWKAELCHENTPVFEYIQELEGRVRLFATMILASLLGFFCAVLGVARLWGTHWEIVMVSMAILSAVICFIFGSNLRRVRGQEVTGVFRAYVSLKLSNYRRRQENISP